MRRNIIIYPWFKFLQSLTFWQATWFLYFEGKLSAADAILLYVVYDIATTLLEVPSGYMSDKVGRKFTLILAGLCSILAATLFVLGSGFFIFALANVLLGAAAAFASGTDTSLLYESLNAEDSASDVENAELKAWRFSFAAMALSALMGGYMATYEPVLPYITTGICAVLLLILTLSFQEPPHVKSTSRRDDFQALKKSLTQPTLKWLLGLTLLMYVFSHIPYVFGQPFIREALTQAGFVSQTPLVSGAVTFSMMVLSLAASWAAKPLRHKIGLPKILLLAFAMQIVLTIALASSNGLFVVALLFLRMVPDSLSQPFIKARIQPLLKDGIRATYMSVQSLAGRILFAITLGFSVTQTSDGTLMPYSDMQIILTAYAVVGLVCFSLLFLTVRSSKV